MLYMHTEYNWHHCFFVTVKFWFLSSLTYFNVILTWISCLLTKYWIVTNPLWVWWLQYKSIICRNTLKNISNHYWSIASWVLPSNHHMAVLAIKGLIVGRIPMNASRLKLINIAYRMGSYLTWCFYPLHNNILYTKLTLRHLTFNS